MQIFLQILTVIGIILLCIIGLVLLIAALVLFVPIRYKIKADKESEISARVQLTWLLHFFCVKYIYPEPGEIVVRIFGAKVWNMKVGAEDEPAGENLKEKKEKSSQKAETMAKPERSDKGNNIEKGNDTEKGDATEKTEVPQEQKQNIFEKIQYKIKNIYGKIKKIFADYEYYRDLLQKKENQLLFERCKSRIFKILKHIKPRIINADVIVGTGEPDTTGYLMAVYGMLLPILGNHINITPDFEHEILEGKIYVKGRITIFNLLYNGARIYFDDQLHLLIDNLTRKDV